METSHTAWSHAMDAQLTKQPVASQQLHTTVGLMAAKSIMVTGDNNVFIMAQCRIKGTSTKDQKNTDPSCGQWGKPWPKDAYMSGKPFVSLQICHFLSSKLILFFKSGRGS